LIAAVVFGAIGLGAIAFGLYRVVDWLRPPPIEMPPPEMRAEPGLQQFLPHSPRRLLARQAPTPDTEEAPAVPSDHPFAKTRVTGRVFDIETGEGIAGALVRVRPTFGDPRLGPSKGDGSASFTSRADGSYAMKGIPPGTFDLDVSATGYAPAKSGFKKFTALEDDDGFDVGLTRGGVLEGRVTQKDGRPIAGAQIFATTGEGISLRKDSKLVTSAADGRFLIDPVDARALQVMAMHPFFGTQVVHLSPSESPERSVEIVLDAARKIAGHVRDDAGPVGDARVTIALQRSSNRMVSVSPELGAAAVKVDRNGAFTVAVPESGPVVLVASAPGYEQSSQMIPEGKTGDQEIEIVLAEAIQFSGRVLGANGRPAVKAEVLVAPMSSRRGSLQATTDDGGRFRIDGLPKSGPYRVVIQHFAHPALMTTEEDLRGEHQYRLEPQARILGNILDANSGTPITRYRYSLEGAMHRQSWAVSVSGAFEVDQLAAGTYALSVHADGYEETSVSGIDVASGQTVQGVQVRMRPAGTIVGRVRGGGQGEMIAQAWDQDGRLEEEQAVAEDGAFSLAGVRSGTYTIIVVASGETGAMRGEVQNVRVESGAVTGGIEVSLEPSTPTNEEGIESIGPGEIRERR
jgi:hypothetical protein